jgi:hypothetical protein
MTMSTDAGFEVLRRAAEAAVARRADDYTVAVARSGRRVDDLRYVATGLQRAVDAANAELLALGLNGAEAEAVITALLCGLMPPDYPLD